MADEPDRDTPEKLNETGLIQEPAQREMGRPQTNPYRRYNEQTGRRCTRYHKHTMSNVSANICNSIPTMRRTMVHAANGQPSCHTGVIHTTILSMHK